MPTAHRGRTARPAERAARQVRHAFVLSTLESVFLRLVPDTDFANCRDDVMAREEQIGERIGFRGESRFLAASAIDPAKSDQVELNHACTRQLTQCARRAGASKISGIF